MNTEKRLYQWDTGQKLVGCTGLYVDFPIGTEVYRVETTDGMCIIPDELLQTSGGHKVYECMTNNTIRSFAFSVTPRPKPPDYVYTPTERLTFEGLVQKVDDAVADMIRRAESGEFDGYTPVKGKDYFTTAEIQQIQNEVSSGAIGEFKSVVDTETETFDNNAETKLTAYNQNDSQKTTAYNTNAETKRNAYNANADNRVAEFDAHTEQIQTDISELKSDLDALYKSIEIPSDYLKAWIRYSNGEQVISSATMLYTFTGHLPKSIKAFLTSDTNVLCAIAFYNSTTISTESYMQSESIDFLDGNHDDGAWYNAIVPDDCKLIAITTKKPSDTIPQPIIKFSRGSQYDFGSPFENKMCFGHLFVNQTNASFSSNIIIPCQSIFDVQITARLGFKYIEANVHKTSDGKYVVTHGISGKLGNDFEKVSDGSRVSDVVISDTTFEVLRTDYCYRSNYDKYKVPITSLEEFLHECKRWGISVVLQYIDETELSIAKGIIGENIILYNGTRTVWDGYIMDYLSLTTKEDIVKRCKEVGKPYMYNMANPTAFTDTELKEIISAVHDLGCYIGFTGAYQSKNNIPKYIDYGFDFNASSMQVNDFELGNLYNCYGDLDFSDIVHTGTVENGVLHLADGQYIQWTENANFLTKVSMHITFSGKLYYMGVASGVFIESDGDNSMWHSIFYNNETPFYKWVSSGDTYIKNITVKASKC